MKLTTEFRKATIVETDDGYLYYDKNGDQLHEGDIIQWDDGETAKLYRSEGGYLGTDATNPAWIESGRAVPCEYGIYPLEWMNMAHIEKIC